MGTIVGTREEMGVRPTFDPVGPVYWQGRFNAAPKTGFRAPFPIAGPVSQHDSDFHPQAEPECEDAPMSDPIGPPALTPNEVDSLRHRHYNATIIERIDVHEDLARFRIRPDEPIAPFDAGQYVAIGLGNWEPRLPGTQVEAITEAKLRKLGRRAYSISCPMIGSDGRVATVGSVDFLEFYITLVRRADDDHKHPPVLTPRLFLLGAGDRIEVQKKIVGTYTLGQIDPDDTVLMLGTGTGEAPHNAMAATLLADGHRGKVINVTSVRKRSDLAYASEHAALAGLHPNYKYLAYTTREPENIDSSHPGYIGKQYLQSLFTSGKLAIDAGDPLSPANTHVFLCGNPSMIGYVPPGSDPPTTPGMLQVLGAAGFSDDQHSNGAGSIRFEKYW